MPGVSFLVESPGTSMITGSLWGLFEVNGFQLQKNLFGQAMAKSKIRAKDAAKGVHAGIGDGVLDNRILKDFLTDLRCGSSTGYMMTKYNLDEKKLESICRALNRSELTAAIELWEGGKLTETQLKRAFSEIKDSLDSDD
jgi:hypothetical protein